ncbi:MAG: Ig-like domain-containing protein, partial [Myxococcota bacterium]
MTKSQSPRIAPLSAAIASFLGATAVAGCQQSDADSLEISPRAADEYVTDHTALGEIEHRVWSMLDGTTKETTHIRYPDPQGLRMGEIEVVLPEGVELERGTYVKAYGDFDDGGRLLADDYEVVSHPAEPIIDPEWYPLRRIATILVFWGEAGGTPNAVARESMFLGDKSTHVFYGENSYGKENVIGEVFGPYQIPDPNGCATGTIANYALQAMVEKGHDPDDYNQYMYAFPFISGCGFGGLASVGSPLNPAQDSWYNGGLGCVVRNQEIGHNYGMGHSHAYACNDGEGNGVPLAFPASERCEHIEYGHPYDPMGGGCGHINTVQKNYMGWIEGCNIVTAPADGTFNLLPTELPCNGTQSLKIPASDGRSYYLEYRRPIGRFDTAPGVLLHIAPTEFGGGPSNYILDVGDNGFLREGDSFTDPDGTVSFTILEEHETHAVIEVTYPDGGSGQPTCQDGEAPLSEGGHVGSLECAVEPHAGDVAPPSVTITFPEDESYFPPGSDFKIIAEAMDDRVVADVELYVNGESFFKKLEEPWEYDVTNIPEGDYEFGIVARDGVNWTASNAVDVHITNDPPPMPSEDESGSGGGTGGPIHESTMDPEFFETEGDDPGANEPIGDTCACSTDGRQGLPTAALLGLMLLG